MIHLLRFDVSESCQPVTVGCPSFKFVWCYRVVIFRPSILFFIKIAQEVGCILSIGPKSQFVPVRVKVILHLVKVFGYFVLFFCFKHFVLEFSCQCSVADCAWCWRHCQASLTATAPPTETEWFFSYCNSILMLSKHLGIKDNAKLLRHQAGKWVRTEVESSGKNTRGNKVKIKGGKAAQSRGPTLFGEPWEEPPIMRFSPSYLKSGVFWWSEYGWGYTRHWALLALCSQDPTAFLPFLFAMWLLTDFNLFQHRPHCLSGNNMSSWSRCRIWEKSGISLPPWRTLGWSLSPSHHTDQLTPLLLQTTIWSSCC